MLVTMQKKNITCIHQASPPVLQHAVSALADGSVPAYRMPSIGPCRGVKRSAVSVYQHVHILLSQNTRAAQISMHTAVHNDDTVRLQQAQA